MTTPLPLPGANARLEIAPGAVHLPGWLDETRQALLVAACREWALGPVPARAAKIRGHPMSVRTLCLGWHWRPYKYARTADDVNGARVLPLPNWLSDWGRRAVADAYAPGLPAGALPGIGFTAGALQGADQATGALLGPDQATGALLGPDQATGALLGPDQATGATPDTDPDAAEATLPEGAGDYRPDIALVNFYDSAAKMGMHQDKDERSAAPVVSFSVGESCVFRFGNPDTRGRPYHDVLLGSGDAFVFGGASRFAFHGVPRTLPNSAPAHCGLTAERINVTLRVSGLSD